MDAHAPYLPPAPYNRMFPGADPSFTKSKYSSLARNVLTLNRRVSEAERRHLISQYDGAIAYMDSQLGALFRTLREVRRFDNSIVIVTSDHGEAFGRRNCLYHGGMSAYQNQIGVPLLIKYPNRRSAEVVHLPVSGVDVFSTVLDTLSFDIPKQAQGQSLLRLRPGESRTIVSESFGECGAYFGNPARFHRSYRAFYTGELKYILSSDGERELYDLSADPAETHNLFISGDPVSRRLEQVAAGWARPSALIKPKARMPNRETVERLKSLGYVQ